MQNHVNWLAVLVAGISAFIIGGIWYSPALLGKAWMKETGITVEQMQKSNKGKVYGWAFVLTLIIAVNLSMFLNSPDIHLSQGLLYGFLTGVWIFCGIAITALFEQKSARYIFINGGYMLVALTLMGAIIGVWK
ncbi:MAG TPA: DUF1761 domain-containing protein [Puia sp.]|jgi:hypothetical protein|nr:DUF1761 domain-containing protein [Puia sp.]